MDFSIDKIIGHLKDLSYKERASVIDHLFIIIAGVLMVVNASLGSSFADMQNQFGYGFAPYVIFGLSMIAIWGSLYGCNVIVNRLISSE